MIVTRDRALLIATDIDGTLLDHDAQLPFRADTWRRAIHALGARAAGCRVAFASSRTLDELMVLQRALGVQGPCIAEDGAVLARAADGASDRDPALAPHDELRAYGRRTMCIWTRAQHAAALRMAMQELDAVQRADASQLDRESLSALGLRTTGAIRRALHARHHSLLLDPSRMPGDERQTIRTIAADRGLQLRRGGRWLTLADLAFVIRNPGRGPHPALTAIPRAVVSDTEGPGGWLEMLNCLQELVQ